MYIVAGNKLLNPEYILKEIEVAAGNRIADLGCGRVGQFTFPAAHMVGKYGAVYAADIQQSIVQAIREAARARQLQNIHPVWADLEDHGSTNIPQGTIDVGLLVATLVHAQKKQNMLTEAMRLLKPGGRLVVIDWHSNTLPFVEKNTTPLLPEEVQQNAQKVGLSFLRIFSAGPHHFGLVFQK